MSDQRDTYTSIAAQFPVWIRKLPDGDSASVYQEYTAFAHDSLESSLSSNLPESVATFLIEMNNKLDSILGMLSIDELRQAFPIETRCTLVGGSGLTFQSDEPFEDGMYVEAVLVLCRIPLRLAGAIGKLSSNDQQQSPSDSGNQLWRLDFTRIRERDLEMVIRFVIEEERRLIRQKKWD